MPTNHQRRALLSFGRIQARNDSPRMPWLNADKEFTDVCTQCQSCIEHCPEEIIRRGDGGYPTIDFSLGECTFCYECAQHCPEDLFVSRQQEPWQLALRVDESCLAAHHIVCQTCRDACEPRAIRFPPTLGVAQPQVDQNACTGCGACISACPTNALSLHHKDLARE